MNILAFDIGDSRIGIASGSTKTKVSSPICVLNPQEILNKSKSFLNIIEDYLPEKFLFGLPKSMDGNQNNQAEHVKEIAEKIALLYNMEYDFIDERFSSKEAKRILSEQGYTQKQMKGKIDSVAASLFLETYLQRL